MIKIKTNNFLKLFNLAFVIFACTAMYVFPVNAAVVSRGDAAAANAAAGRASASNASARMPTLTTQMQSQTKTQSVSDPEPAYDPEPEIYYEPEPELIIENKTNQFDSVLSKSSTSDAKNNAANTELAEMIRRQRAALDSRDATDLANTTQQNALGGISACDTGLRKCMEGKCGKNFVKCKGDTDTAWGDKMDLCRRDLKCTGEEYRLFSTEIKADRDMYARIAAYQAILECGASYNGCIEEQCGPTLSKCIGKTAGDAAISKCATIAKNCTQQDSGLAGRTMNVFATLRQDAEKQVKKDEARLYELRDLMRAQCSRLGAMFDERSLDCVFTVNFFAANSQHPYASKKAYAGSTFDCTQNWFGIDVTTFKENAYRLTREQTSASSALLGSGVGMAVGAITSGAIDRAIDRSKAEKALNKAEKEYDKNYGDKSDDKKSDAGKKKDKEDKSADSDKPADGDKSADGDKPAEESTGGESGGDDSGGGDSGGGDSGGGDSGGGGSGGGDSGGGGSGGGDSGGGDSGGGGE